MLRSAASVLFLLQACTPERIRKEIANCTLADNPFRKTADVRKSSCWYLKAKMEYWLRSTGVKNRCRRSTTVSAISQLSTPVIYRGGGPACQVAREKKRLEEVLTTRAEMLANHEKACYVFRAAVFVRVVV